MNFYSIPPLLTFVCFIALAVLTVARWRNSRVNKLFLLICILGAGLYADILFIFNTPSVEAALLVTRIDQFFSLFLIPLYVHFFHAYLGIRKRKWLVAGFYTVPGILVWFGMSPLLIESMHHYPFGYFGRAGKLYPFIAISAVCATGYGAWILGHAIYREGERNRKRRLEYLFIGFVSIAVLTGMNFIPLYGHPLYPPGNFCFIPLLLFAIGIFRHDLLNTGLFLKKGLVYSVLTAALTGIYAIIIVVANRLFSVAGFSESFLLHAMLFIVIAFIFGPLNIYIRKNVDRVFNKKQYNYRKIIRKNSRMIASVLQIEEVARQLIETIRYSMGVGHCLIFIRTGGHGRVLSCKGWSPEEADRYPGRLAPGNPLLEYFGRHNNSAYRKKTGPISGRAGDNFLLNEMLDRYDATLVVPMIFKGTLNGLVITGEKDCGAPFSLEDMDLIETLASHGALAVENAGTYQALENLNRSLEIRVAERTRRLKIALKEKERTMEQLIQSESLAAIGQLVAGIAHELNNPLASVKSLLQSVLEDLEPDEEHNDSIGDLLDDLRFADRELDRAGSIVSSLLGLSRQTQTYCEPVDVNSVLNDALRVLHNKYKRFELSLEKKFSQQLPLITGNFSNLGQVAINIIGNAIDALPEQKGTITLVTAYNPESDTVIFECTDTGPGIPDAIRREIFKPFFTTKPVGRGTGLGLYICHEIVSRHGGSITVNNAPGNGARVIVRLPKNSNQTKETAAIDIGQARH